MEHKHLKTMVRKTMEHALLHPVGWSLQGLGMLRFYYSNELRLHVWDDRFLFLKDGKRPSELHTHPWHLRSTVIAGQLTNRRFIYHAFGETFHRQKLLCGPNGCLIGEPDDVRLKSDLHEIYEEGDSYTQRAEEIHMSRPIRGTVTLVERSMTDNPDHAFVFWNGDSGFLSAEPRPATSDEVSTIIGSSLEKWFK